MITTSNQISPGTTLSLDGKIYRVETSVKVTVAKGVPFIKTKLKNLMSDEVIEKNFKLDQAIEEVTLNERGLEFLYLEGKNYLFLDDQLDKVLVSADVVGDKVHYLKEGIELKAMFYGETIFSIELPQFLELMVVNIEDAKSKVSVSSASSKVAILETGAKIEVPLFIEVGDVIKVDTHLGEYVQRI